MKVLKIAGICVLIVGICAYLIFAMIDFNTPREEKACSGVLLTIDNSTPSAFIDANEIIRILKEKNLYPQGKKMSYIDSRKIENTLLQNPFIEKAECYKTPGGKINITILQRLPTIRIISINGDSYYLDHQGKIMPGRNYAASLVIATGYINKKYAIHHLSKIGRILQEDKFWNYQLEQVYVLKTGEIELVPRVGDQIIFIGKPTQLKDKFKRLKLFYKYGLSKIGWNKYSRIDAQYSNQIICTKRQ